MLKITLQYCAVWHYTPRAVSSAAELLETYEPEIESITHIPSDGGRVELNVNGKLLYSKLSTGRHVEPGEVKNIVGKFLKEGK